EEALTQLPIEGINVVVFGQIQGSRDHLERALFRGAPVADFLTNRVTKKYLGVQWRHVGSTVFDNPAFSRLSGVLWVRLSQLIGPLQCAYELYANPSAATPMVPTLVTTIREE